MSGATAGWAQEVLARREVWGRAPSAHNTQPWVVSVEGTGQQEHLTLGWDESRHLADGDPTRRDLLLGLGALAESLEVVAADAGHAVATTWQVDVRRRHAARLHRLGPVDPAARPPFTGEDLLARRTARSAYQEPRADDGDVAAVARAARLPEGAALAVVDPVWVERWLPVADRWALEGPAAQELSRWLRLSPRHPSYRADGLSDEALGLSRVEALGLRVATTGPGRRLLSRTGAVRFLAASATARPLGTVVALTVPGPPDLDELGHLGAALLRLWLAAGRRGLSTHPLSALLDCPASLAAWPGAGPGGTPVSVFRLGRPSTPAPSSARL